MYFCFQTSLHLNNCSIGFVIDPKNVEVENWDSTHKLAFDNFLTNHLNADIVNEVIYCMGFLVSLMSAVVCVYKQSLQVNICLIYLYIICTINSNKCGNVWQVRQLLHFMDKCSIFYSFATTSCNQS